MYCLTLINVLSGLRQYVVRHRLSEGLGQELYLDVGAYTLVQDVVDGIQYGHVHVQVLVDVLHALGAEVALGYHLHFQLRTFHGVSLAYHGTEDTVAREVGVTSYQQVATIYTVYDASVQGEYRR